MPIKILRLGFTEMTLLFYYWHKKYENNTNDTIINSKKWMIKWLYTTSGYYDKTIKSCYMDAEHSNTDPEIYDKYMEIILNFIKYSDNFTHGCHYSTDSEEFKRFYNQLEIKKNHPIIPNVFFNMINNRKILLISPFSKLFKLQIESGNCKKIWNNFPIIEKAYYYSNIYTFFNNGPHNNILETVDYLIDDINKIIEDNYDMVIISAGAYSNLLAKYFYEKNKDVITIGGELQKYFGILNGREKVKLGDNKLENEEYWITTIPDEYKPHDYMKIENGCYW